MPILETKYSPGPWEIEHIYTEDQIMGSMTIMCHNGRPIAKTNHSLISKNLPPEEILANARLIAAAPDLYESLKGFLEHVLHNYDLTERENKKFAELANSGLAAITKAETV